MLARMTEAAIRRHGIPRGLGCLEDTVEDPNLPVRGIAHDLDDLHATGLNLQG